MGRSRILKKSIRVDEEHGEDTLSTGFTELSVESGSSKVKQKPHKASVLDEFVEALFEKRPAARESGLRGLIGALTSSVLGDFVEEKYETLLFLFMNSAKRGSTSETALAARGIGLLALTAGPGAIADQIMGEAFPYLVKVARSCSSPAACISALETLAILPFVGDSQLEAIESAIGTLCQICTFNENYRSDQILGTEKPTGSVKAAAVLSWALLLSTFPTASRARKHVALGLTTLSNLLKDDDLSVRAAAVDAVTLMYNAFNSYSQERTFPPNDETSDNSDLDSSRPEVGHNVAASSNQGLEVTEQIKALSIFAGDKEESEEYLSQCAPVEEQVGMENEVSRNLQLVVPRSVNTTNAIQLNALRRVLEEGYPCHSQKNIFLRQIFKFRPQVHTCQTTSTKEKRLYSSQSSGRNLVRNEPRTLAQQNILEHQTYKSEFLEQRQTLSSKEKRLYMSPNSARSKTRTQLRDRHRTMSHAGNVGHYSVNVHND